MSDLGLGAQLERAVQRGDAPFEDSVVRRRLGPARRDDGDERGVAVTLDGDAELVGALRQRGRELLDDAQDGERLAGAHRVAQVHVADLGVGPDLFPQELELQRERRAQVGRDVDARPGRRLEARRAGEPGLADPLQGPEGAGAGVAGGAQPGGQLRVGPVLFGELLAQRRHAGLEVLGGPARVVQRGVLRLEHLRHPTVPHHGDEHHDHNHRERGDGDDPGHEISRPARR